jgi:SAM-dependent methyltransferase
LGIKLHQDQVNKNHEYWKHKPVLQSVYKDFYNQIKLNLSGLPDSKVVELGSGLGNIHEVMPRCIRTDLFPYPWIDQVENAYQLSFEDETVSDLILTDVFHHLRYPGTALKELNRVLRKNGCVIMLEPSLSLLGSVIYGIFHTEPIAVTKKIEWFAPEEWSPEQIDYYAAQGNATRIFVGGKYHSALKDWQTVKVIRLSALAYAASGGYSFSQFYPTAMLPLFKTVEKILDLFPSLFATRLLVILEK